MLFGVAYGLLHGGLRARPVLNLAAGALFGAQAGLAAAVGGTVLGAGISFTLGRVLGQDGLRPLLRGRFLELADGQLSRHGFRSTLAIRLFPGDAVRGGQLLRGGLPDGVRAVPGRHEGSAACPTRRRT